MEHRYIPCEFFFSQSHRKDVCLLMTEEFHQIHIPFLCVAVAAAVVSSVVDLTKGTCASGFSRDQNAPGVYP